MRGKREIKKRMYEAKDRLEEAHWKGDWEYKIYWRGYVRALEWVLEESESKGKRGRTSR